MANQKNRVLKTREEIEDHYLFKKVAYPNKFGRVRVGVVKAVLVVGTGDDKYYGLKIRDEKTNNMTYCKPDLGMVLKL